MTTIKEIFDFINSIAPVESQESFDNSGFLFGDINSEVSGILLTLDVTSDVINEAVKSNCNLIISHHPLIFGNLSNVVSKDPTGIKIQSLARNNLNVISMHTNLDKSLVNKVLIKKVSDYNFNQINEYMWSGELEDSLELKDYLVRLKSSLSAPGLRYYDSGRKVNKIACIGGSGEFGLSDAVESGCDTLVTADIKHHSFLAAKELGINLIDANHHSTETVVLNELNSILSARFPNDNLLISESDVMVIEYA